MTEQTFKPQTYGIFEARGVITVDPDTFQIDLKGKNNPSFNYSRINMKMEDNKGGSFWLNAMDGFNTSKGRTIYANIKDDENNGMMEISFADRFNEEILKNVDNRSFISVALRKIENEEGKMIWDYQNFLALYDAINFIKDRLQTGMKLYVRGRIGYSTYNDNLNKDLQIQKIYLIQDDDERELGFTFNQPVLLTSDSLDDSKWEDEHIMKVNSKLYFAKKNRDTNKKEVEVYTLPLTLRATESTKEKYQRVVDRYLKVEQDKVRKIRLEGRFNIGYTQGNIKEEDLPDDAKELIEDGLYEKEEVLKMYANRDRVDEMLIVRPVLIRPRNEGDKPYIDMDDKQYTIEDLEASTYKEEPIKEVVIEDEDLSFLDELE